MRTKLVKNFRLSFSHRLKLKLVILMLAFVSLSSLNAQFVHPGISHKKSDLERMKLMVEAGIDPWTTTFQQLKANSSSSYNYTVRGNASNTVLDNFGEFLDDGYASYSNALMWYITGDERHAKKCVEIYKAWVNLTSVSTTMPLETGRVIWKFLEGAEIIRHTYDGWAEEDIKKLEDMLVYPGYSTTEEPTTAKQNNNVTFYWSMYNGDSGRHGNQGLFAFRGIMAMGIFMDNEIMYQRAFRYLQGLPHLPEDLAYEPGPPITYELMESSNEFYNEFKSRGEKENTIEDYGYNEVIANNIWENGQNQESSRDQSHALLGPSIITVMCEMAWNQGDDMYSHLDNRPLLGLEHYFRYNLSFYHSFPDQLEPWEPTVENGEFIQRLCRTGRWESLKINPWTGADLDRLSRGGKNNAPVYEMNLGHYKYRMNVENSKTKWLERGFKLMTEAIGVEDESNASDHPGWGGLKFRRVSPGDPISSFTANVPNFDMNVIPGSIQAENYDYFSINGEGRTYHDITASNTGGQYRTDEGVDIETCSEGGYNLTGLEDGEWLSYTVAVPTTRLYNISIRYASANANGKIKFTANGIDITSDLVVPFGDVNSTGLSDWKDYTIASDVIMAQGVQALKISISGESNAFVLNSLSITEGSDASCDNALPSVDVVSFITPGINYSYYEGTWDALPDFTTLTALETGLNNEISFIEGWSTDNFAAVYTGYIEIPLDGMYTFYTSSDEGSRLYIDGNLLVDNDGIHTKTVVSGGACLKEGYHEIKVEYFEKTGNEGLTVQYEGPGIAKRNLEGLLALGDCENAAVELPNDAVAGLGYYYYEGTWTLLPDFDKLEVLGMGTTNTVNLNMAKVSDYFGVVFTGYINVAEDGDYTFYTTSDDGSALYIDGNKIVTNDGTHGNVTKSGNMCLAAGWHQIEVHYFENSGGQSLSVQWEGKGFSRRNITGYYTKPISTPVKKNQSITFNRLIRYLGEEDFTAATTSSGLPITYASYNTEVATVVDGKVHLVAEGEARIRATQSGNLFYNAANVQFGNIIVSPKESQTITVSNMTKYVGDEDFDPALASSGLPITYTSYKTNVATIANNKIHIEGPGSVFIRVAQAGNYKYLPATSKIFTLTVEQQTAIEDVLARSIKVYPNPAEDLLYIQSENLIGAELDVISLLGEHINSNRIESETTTVNLQNLNKGVYIIKITIDGKAFNYKVVKE